VSRKTKYDGIVIGSGPNGLSAAIVLARAGRSVLVLEAENQIGGGARTAALTLPGYLHDLGSAVHPMAVASPFLRTLPLHEHGLEWTHSPLPLAHPFDDGSAAILHHSLEQTCHSLGADGVGYAKLVGPVVTKWNLLEDDILGPLRLPSHPLAFALFGLSAVQPSAFRAKSVFKSEPGRALFAGLAAHSARPLDTLGTSAIGLVLAAVSHVKGWPIPKGGSQSITNALASYLRSLGGEIETGVRVQSLKELPASNLVLCDLSPRGLLDIAGNSLSGSYKSALEKFQYGPGVFKVDWALDGPIPWTAHHCSQAGTIHIGGTLDEIAHSERACWRDETSEKPFILLSQPSLFDPTRAPKGRHTAWAYCHVPSGSEVDMTARIEAQVERFAPGFRDLILARSTRSPAQIQHENANLVGGNVTGGANSLRQLLLRPTYRFYTTPAKGLYLCSASTPPGGGVHGMCGYHAATRALANHPRQ
jgi:phytoene dehydrogenase-like protein